MHPFLSHDFHLRWSTLTPDPVQADIDEALTRAEANLDALISQDRGTMNFDSVVLGLGEYRVRLGEGDSAELDTRHLGPGWQINPHSTQPPRVRFEDGKLFVRHGASTLNVNGVPVEGDEVPVAPGTTMMFGPYAKLRVDGVVESTVSVRSVFGNVSSKTTDVVIQPRASDVRAALETEREATRLAQAKAEDGVGR